MGIGGFRKKKPAAAEPVTPEEPVPEPPNTTETTSNAVKQGALEAIKRRRRAAAGLGAFGMGFGMAAGNLLGSMAQRSIGRDVKGTTTLIGK